jgi:hypothetical protein
MLGTWDVSGLAPGTYTVRLTVNDRSGLVAAATRGVEVVSPILITAAFAQPATFIPDHASLLLGYQLSMPANVEVLVLGEGSNHPVWTSGLMPQGAFGGMAGTNSLLWDGRNDQGLFVTPGTYQAVIAASTGIFKDRRSLWLTAQASPEYLAGQPGGGGGLNGGGAKPGGGGASAAAASASGSGVAGSVGATSPSSDPHDNGWHDGNNPNNFVIDHSDQSQGQGNNHH